MKTPVKTICMPILAAVALSSSSAYAQQAEIIKKDTTVPQPVQQPVEQATEQPQTPQPVEQSDAVEPAQDTSDTPEIRESDRGLPADSADDKTLEGLKIDAEELVLDAEFTLRKIARHEEYNAQFTEHIKQAKAIIIFPQIIKGAFAVLGAEGGNGVLLAKAPNGKWSYPSFYTTLAGSAGLQIGAQSSEMVVLVMTEKALVATLKHRVHLGGELNVAAGVEGVGYEKGITTKTDFKQPDLHSYILNKGLFIGAGFEGSYMMERNTMNQAFYNSKPDEATTKSIIIQGQLANDKANPLRDTLYRFSSAQ